MKPWFPDDESGIMPQLTFVDGGSVKNIKDAEQRSAVRSQLAKSNFRPRGRKKADKSQTANVSVQRRLATAHSSPPLTLLTSTRKDPFSTYNLSVEETDSHAIYDYCVHDLWPSFRPGGHYATEFGRYWFVEAANNQAVMAAILYSAFIHRSLRRPQPDDATRQLRLKGDAISSLRTSLIRGVPDDKVDITIYAILCLASNEAACAKGLIPADKTLFRTDLIEDQWVNMYGRIQVDATHFEAVVALVRSKGGLETIKTYSVGWLVFFAGLMGAAATASEPPFPHVTLHGELYEYQSPLQIVFGLHSPRDFKGSGFELLTEMSLPSELVKPLLDLTEMSQALELFMMGMHDTNLTALLDSRADLTHRLLSLPPSAENLIMTQNSQELASWYRCARAASQLYCLNVMFPYPRKKAFTAKLVPEIQNCIASLFQLDLEHSRLKLMLWACIVTAASSAEHRETETRFQTQTLKIMHRLTLQSFEELQHILKSFAWIDLACPGYLLSIWQTYSPATIP